MSREEHRHPNNEDASYTSERTASALEAASIQAHARVSNRPQVQQDITRTERNDDDFGAVGAEPTKPAKYAGTCATCRQRFAVGDPIAAVLVDKKTTYHHAASRYPATALLAQHNAEIDVDAVAVARKASSPGKCRATTNKGKPCNNTAQKGEQLCGPHLIQLVARPIPARQSTTSPTPTNRSDSVQPRTGDHAAIPGDA